MAPSFGTFKHEYSLPRFSLHLNQPSFNMCTSVSLNKPLLIGLYLLKLILSRNRLF